MKEVIFGNKIKKSLIRKAERKQKNYIRKFSDDRDQNYQLSVEPIEALKEIGVKNIKLDTGNEQINSENAIIIGNIRMGFGHYRIAMAIASAANSMGYTPYWFDLVSFEKANSGKIIGHLNYLYSLGSRLSQKSKLFNNFYWEKMTTDGFKKISYNYVDQKISELMTGVYKNLDKSIPYIGTHVWNAQTAIHAGMERVINVIPDNYPLALHLAEGSIHTVQTPSSYMGYRTLTDMGDNDILNEIPNSDIKCVGHYVDHELVINIETDCDNRLKRIATGANKRVLISIGGAGAQQDLTERIINHLMPLLKEKKIALFINVGDHLNVWKGIEKSIPELSKLTTKFFNNWIGIKKFSEEISDQDIDGVFAFYNQDIFSAVYSSNLLMRQTDIFITKPSELSFYPVPKLMCQRVGGHEAWGAIRSSEIGDGTIECETTEKTLQMLDLMIRENDILEMICDNIIKNKQSGMYNGAYEVIKLAVKI